MVRNLALPSRWKTNLGKYFLASFCWQSMTQKCTLRIRNMRDLDYCYLWQKFVFQHVQLLHDLLSDLLSFGFIDDFNSHVEHGWHGFVVAHLQSDVHDITHVGSVADPVHFRLPDPALSKTSKNHSKNNILQKLGYFLL